MSRPSTLISFHTHTVVHGWERYSSEPHSAAALILGLPYFTAVVTNDGHQRFGRLQSPR